MKEALGLSAAFLAAALTSSPPRVISIVDELKPVLLFTDGAYEQENNEMQGSSGLVVIDTTSSLRIVQEVAVPEPLHTHWKRGGSKQLISLMELWPVLAAIQAYGKTFYNRRCLSFIDNNNAVRDGLIKGSSPVCDMFSLLSVVSLDIAKYSLSMWFTRIPSKSNPADDPSRGRSVDIAKELGAEVLQLLEPSHELVSGLQSIGSFITYMQQRVSSDAALAASVEKGVVGVAGLQ